MAIVLMVAFHFVFDLDYLSFISINLQSGFWFFFPRAIGATFLFVVGVSLVLSDKHDRETGNEGYVRHFRRGLLLAGVAALITIATWIYPNEGFITFGIIDLIALSMFIAPFFLRFRKLNIPIGLAVIIIGIFLSGMQTGSHYLFWLGITFPGYAALDYYPLLPWFGFVLIGIGAGGMLFEEGRDMIRLGKSKVSDALSSLGRNSLAVYLLHQLVLFGGLLLIRMVIGG
jgi:uncharacterized membrane protein